MILHNAKHLARGINLIKNSKITIGSITVDGGRAQLKALSFEWDGSLRNRYIDDSEYIKKILVNHCLCHKINNAYKHAYDKSDDINSLVDSIREVADICREHIADIKEVCPSVQLTRWIIDYDVCNFILKHQEETRQLILRFFV